MRIGIAEREIEDDELLEAHEIEPRPRRVAGDDAGRFLVARSIFATELGTARFAEDLRKILKPEPLAIETVEALDEQGEPIDPDNGRGLTARHFALAQYFAGEPEAQRLVLDEGRLVVVVELGDMRRGIAGLDRRTESRAVLPGEELALHPRYGARCGDRGFFDRAAVDMMDGHDTVGRQDADRADAVGAILQQDSEIIIVGGADRARLQPAQPAFRTEMLEKRDESVAAYMIARRRGQRAGDIRGPAVVISEMAAAPGFSEHPSANAFPGYNGLPTGDQASPNQIRFASTLSADTI